MNIGHIDINEDVLVIAEIGNNHEGDFELAQRMIASAAGAGAQAVKFQTIDPGKLVAPTNKAALDLFTRFQFSEDQFRKLKETADDEGVMFLSTPFDIDSARFLDPLVPAFKIASGDNNYWPLIEAVAETGKPIILSTGMADFDGIVRAQQFIHKAWEKFAIEQKLVVLHCVSLYPTPPDQANLLTIPYLQEHLPTCLVGYSDHTLGIDAAVLAVALGARVIEKHFTLDKNYSDFPDHQISMDPDDLKQLMPKIRETRALLGVKGVILGEEEMQCSQGGRRSIVAKHDLAQGHALTWDDLDWLRPGGGLPPGEEEQLLGKRLKQDHPKGQALLPNDLE